MNDLKESQLFQSVLQAAKVTTQLIETRKCNAIIAKNLAIYNMNIPNQSSQRTTPSAIVVAVGAVAMAIHVVAVVVA